MVSFVRMGSCCSSSRLRKRRGVEVQDAEQAVIVGHVLAGVLQHPAQRELLLGLQHLEGPALVLLQPQVVGEEAPVAHLVGGYELEPVQHRAVPCSRQEAKLSGYCSTNLTMNAFTSIFSFSRASRFARHSRFNPGREIRVSARSSASCGEA